MKKTYLQPTTEIFNLGVKVEMMNPASVQNVGGNSGIGVADPTEPIPGEADVKESIFEENPWEF